jgi:hypothetical protein
MDDINRHFIVYSVYVIVPQVGPNRLIPFIKLFCPVSEAAGHAHLGFFGRRHSKDPTVSCLTHQIIQLFCKKGLPGVGQGGFDSKGLVDNAAVLIARTICTNDDGRDEPLVPGNKCDCCRGWRDDEGDSMGRALLVVLKLIRDVGGKSALLLFCGDSKKSNKLIEMVRDYVDALQEFGTHGARFNYPIPGYTTEHQCWTCYGQLADTDTVVQPVFEAIGFQPDKSFLDIGY